ncbi:hypothetical protein AURDEDRAFT_132025, partial [Auricularia subglabra TFB-10046 SS5]
MRGAGRSSPAVLDVAGPLAAAETPSAVGQGPAPALPAPTPPAPAPPAPAPPSSATPAPACPASPPPQRARVPVTKDGKSRSRGLPAIVRSDHPDEDGERPPKPPLYALTPKGRLQARHKRDLAVAAESEKAHEAAREFLCKTTDKLGIDRKEFLHEGYPGATLVPNQDWNTFHALTVFKDWDVRAQYDFGDMTAKQAWEHFKKTEADYSHIMRRFGYAFPEGTGIRTLGQMDRYFWALSYVMAGQHSATDGGLAWTDLAPNAQKFLEMFGIRDLNVFTCAYQGHVQNIANMNEIAGLIGEPLPSGSIDLNREPKMTNPALYKDWDIGRIWCDVNTSLTE